MFGLSESLMRGMVNVPISWQLALPQSLWILGIPWMKMVLHFTVSQIEPIVALHGVPWIKHNSIWKHQLDKEQLLQIISILGRSVHMWKSKSSTNCVTKLVFHAKPIRFSFVHTLQLHLCQLQKNAAEAPLLAYAKPWGQYVGFCYKQVQNVWWMRKSCEGWPGQQSTR